MVEYSRKRLDRVFAAVADSTRRAILAQLAEGTARVTEIAAPFRISLNAISKHLQVLERAGLIQREVVGRDHYCSLRARALRAAQGWLEYYQQFWDVRLDALERHVMAKKKLREHKEKDGKRSHRQAGRSQNDSRQPRRSVRRLDRSR